MITHHILFGKGRHYGQIKIKGVFRTNTTCFKMFSKFLMLSTLYIKSKFVCQKRESECAVVCQWSSSHQSSLPSLHHYWQRIHPPRWCQEILAKLWSGNGGQKTGSQPWLLKCAHGPAAMASPGSLSEKQNSRLHPRSTEQDCILTRSLVTSHAR